MKRIIGPVVIATAVFLLWAGLQAVGDGIQTYVNPSRLNLQIGRPGFAPRGPLAADVVHLKYVDQTAGRWIAAHRVPAESADPTLLWTGERDGRFLSIVEVTLADDVTVTLQISGRLFDVSVERVVPGSGNSSVIPVLGTTADRLLLSTQITKMRIGAQTPTITDHLTEPIVTDACQLVPLTIADPFIISVPLFYLRPTDDRLSRLWSIGAAHLPNLCGLAKARQLPISVGQVGLVNIAPNQEIGGYDETLYANGEPRNYADFVDWSAGAYERSTANLTEPDGSGTPVWSKPDPEQPKSGVPQLLPFLIPGGNYVLARWPAGYYFVQSLTEVERISASENVELWRATGPDASVTWVDTKGATITRTLPQ